MDLEIDDVYEKYFKRVYFYVKRIIGDVGTNEDIEECVSDVFFSIWKEKEKYKSERGTLDTFINVKTRSISLTYRKKLINKQMKFSEEDLDENIKENENYNTENIVLDNFKRDEILTEIKRFKEPNRSYFYLRYFMNYEVKAIAAMFNTTVSAVDNRLYRCRLILKESFGREFS